MYDVGDEWDRHITRFGGYSLATLDGFAEEGMAAYSDTPVGYGWTITRTHCGSGHTVQAPDPDCSWCAYQLNLVKREGPTFFVRDPDQDLGLAGARVTSRIYRVRQAGSAPGQAQPPAVSAVPEQLSARTLHCGREAGC